MILKVAVVNDCALVTAGIKVVLGAFPQRVRVVRLHTQTPPRAQVDVLLYDPLFPSSGPALNLRPSSNQGRLAALGWHVDPGGGRAFIRAGVDGYIFKGLPPEQFVDAIERVHRGELVMPPATGGPANVVWRWPGDEAGLSLRESEVMAMICQGLSNLDIAEAVVVSINTVKTYIRSAYRKIGITTRSQAVIWGLANGFDPRSSPILSPSVVRTRQTVA